MKKQFLSFLKEEDGQTSTEYILLVAVVALIVFKFKDVASAKLNSITQSVFGNAESFVNEMGN
ncbi:MAG: Flp family type IVb pilin [Bacteriovoracaceae bacterium]